MQPLDLGVFGPFKARCKTAFNDFMAMHPVQSIRIDNIPNLITTPYLLSYTPLNIINSLKKTGIWPINKLTFDDEDFSAAFVTDRLQPEPSTGINNNGNETGEPLQTIPNEENSLPSHSRMQPKINMISNVIIYKTTINIDTYSIVEYCLNEVIEAVLNLTLHKNSTLNQLSVSPYSIRPLPKAPSRKTNKKSRLEKSRIFTSTPEKIRVEELEEIRRKKLQTTRIPKRTELQKLKCQKGINKVIPKRKLKDKSNKIKKNKKRIESSPSDTELKSDIDKYNSDIDVNIGVEESDTNEPLDLLDDRTLEKRDYILFNFPMKKTIRYYIGEIQEIQDYS
ncbi:hypothetical protein NQ314_018712 [Rhamnusium bicolor]|uniref:Uncharacterized protein n=1 Tax=Rhamnusium bicolor TaxID=1586634 RepID=A0AAV8WR16_9CUCU|nr:hypothetical protein NQ314_018712 [Rhamnusium bicolor]